MKIKIPSQLPLHQELMLLGIDDQAGKIVQVFSQAGIVKAILAELTLQNRIEINSQKKVVLLSATPTGDGVLDSVLSEIQKAKQPASTTTWVSKHAEGSKLRDQIVEQLCQAKILREVQSTSVFKIKTFPEAKPEVERKIRRRMAKLLYGLTIQHDCRTTLLVILAKKSGLLKFNFDVDRMLRHDQRIKKIVAGSMLRARLPRRQFLKVKPLIQLTSGC